MMKPFYLLLCLFLIHLSNFILVKMIATKKKKKTVIQHAKEVKHNNPGLVDFAIRLVNSLLMSS